MPHPATLPPRPCHTFSLRTVEKLHQQHLENTGAHVRPEQIPTFIEDVRNNLARVEEALRYRLQQPAYVYQTSKEQQPLLSKFERIRVGQILADLVLDIATISIASSNETYDAVVNTNTAVSLSTSHVGLTPLLYCETEEFLPDEEQKLQEQKQQKEELQQEKQNIDNKYYLNKFEIYGETDESLNLASCINRMEYPLDSLKLESVVHPSKTTIKELPLDKLGVEMDSQGDLVIGSTQTLLPSSSLLTMTTGGSDGGSEFSLLAPGKSVTTPPGSKKLVKNFSSCVEKLQNVSQKQLQTQNTISSIESYTNSSNSKRTKGFESSHDIITYQHPLSLSESPLSPMSVRFKPVLSMHSGAESSTACPPLLRRPPPRKYYDIDFQKLSDFTRCLRAVQRLYFSETDFEKIGLRYAIPGIRELDPSEVRSFIDRVDERCTFTGDPFNRPGDDDFFVKRTVSITSTGGGTEVDTRSVYHTQRESNTSHTDTPPQVISDLHLFDLENPVTSNMSPCQSITPGKIPGQATPTSDARGSPSQTFLCRDHCLPLFRGGKEIVVQKKDLQIFLAMVEAKLKQVDQEVDGRLHIAGADLASSSGEEDTVYTT